MSEATGERAHFAAVVLAQGAAEADAIRVQWIASALRDAGADPVVIALPRGISAPPGTRCVIVASGGSAISALRVGLAQLGNSSARHVLLWPLDAAPLVMEQLRSFVNSAVEDGATITAFEDDDLDRAPVMIAREAWLDLMTLGDRGLAAVASRHAVRRVSRRPPTT